MTGMILYGSTLSPFVRKTMAFAHEKGLRLTLKPGGMAGGGAEFDETSPFRKMPGFRDPGADGGRDFTISDSSAIVQYLEARHPEPNLIPIDPANRARTIWYEEFGDTIVAKLSGACFFNRIVAPRFLKQPGDEAAAARAEAEELPPVMDYLERIVPDAGDFLVAGRITLADLAVASPFVNLAHVAVAIDAGRWPRATAYLDAILARPSFSAMVEQERQFLAATA